MYHDELTQNPHGVVRLSRVCNLTASSAATIWRRAKEDPSFPKPFKLSPGITVWDKAEILDWLKTKKAERGNR